MHELQRALEQRSRQLLTTSVQEFAVDMHSMLAQLLTLAYLALQLLAQHRLVFNSIPQLASLFVFEFAKGDELLAD